MPIFDHLHFEGKQTVLAMRAGVAAAHAIEQVGVFECDEFVWFEFVWFEFVSFEVVCFEFIWTNCLREINQFWVAN